MKYKKSIVAPDIVVNNIEMNRVINGDTWHLKSPRVEHKEGILYGSSLDITIETKDNKTIYVLAKNGIFSRDTNNLELSFSKTSLKENEKEYHLFSDYSKYTDKDKLWKFEKNVRILSKNLTAESTFAQYDMNTGDCVLSKDASITYEK